MLIIISGKPGSGKSRIAKQLLSVAVPNSKLYDGMQPKKPSDFPKSEFVLTIITTNSGLEYPRWVHNFSFKEWKIEDHPYEHQVV